MKSLNSYYKEQANIQQSWNSAMDNAANPPSDFIMKDMKNSQWYKSLFKKANEHPVSPEQFYNKLVKSGNKDLAEEFMQNVMPAITRTISQAQPIYLTKTRFGNLKSSPQQHLDEPPFINAWDVEKKLISMWIKHKDTAFEDKIEQNLKDCKGGGYTSKAGIICNNHAKAEINYWTQCLLECYNPPKKVKEETKSWER